MIKIYFSKLSIAKQFLVISMSIITSILLGVIFYMVNSSISSKNQQYQVMINGRTRSIVEKIDRNLYERFGDVQAFAVNQAAIEAAQSKSNNIVLQKFINTMINYYVFYDLMMICDADGKVVATNTMDRQQKLVNNEFLLGKDFSKEEWFKSCMRGQDIDGGAWYSDYVENSDVKSIDNTLGGGLAFAAPIKDHNGNTIGVWYNFANSEKITSSIRQETEEAFAKAIPGTFILVTDADGKVLDCEDKQLNQNLQINSKSFNEGQEFQFQGKKINKDLYVSGSMQGVGSYTYNGKNWIAIAFVPKSRFSFSYVIENMLGLVIAILAVLVLVAFLLFAWAQKIGQQINSVKNSMGILATGELIAIEDSSLQNEIGDMTKNLKFLVARMSETVQFSKKIGEGDLEASYQAASEKDELGITLLQMRENLVKIRVEDRQREWATTGSAKIGELLRSNFQNSTVMYDAVLKFIIKYTNSNQGGLFLISDDEQSNTLDLVASYAYERKKFIQQKIEIGEGLVGQCFIEKDTIYLTDIPEEYISITSGLGSASPNAIIILPLKVNDIIVGVLELASFNTYQDYEQALLTKFSETLAASISTLKINERTKLLLEQSQQQSEEMKAQEEEIRQNMEEMSSIQEEMQRKENEIMAQLNALNNSQAMIEFDLNGNILNANENFLKIMKYSKEQIKGQHHRLLVPKEYGTSQDFKDFWKSVRSGQTKSSEVCRIDSNGETVWLYANYNHVTDSKGNITKIIKVARDISIEKKNKEG